MEIKEVKREIARILKSELADTNFSAFFFGSRVAETHTATSDLDVGIEGTTTVPKNTLRSIKSRCAAIPTLYTIDIVDFSMLSEDFKKVAKSNIERISF
ncbi:MAG: nucleotidyltransferase domain-containing protein [Patescibacteria group bacterium]